MDLKPTTATELGSETATVDKHQISELTDEIVDDLIKNSFKPVPVNIEKDNEEDQMGAETKGL